MRCLLGVVALAALAGLAGLVAILLGLPDVAATQPHWGVTRWVLATTMERSVHRRAADVAVPADLDDPARVRAGASAYDAMCVGCHGAPGVEPGAVHEGLLPEPPELAEDADAWGEPELFWVVKHGVRMTGMPAFGPTHTDRELWDVVALLRRLPHLSPDAYRALVEEGGGAHAHAHDEDAHEHGEDAHGGGAHAH